MVFTVNINSQGRQDHRYNYVFRWRIRVLLFRKKAWTVTKTMPGKYFSSWNLNGARWWWCPQRFSGEHGVFEALKLDYSETSGLGLSKNLSCHKSWDYSPPLRALGWLFKEAQMEAGVLWNFSAGRGLPGGFQVLGCQIYQLFVACRELWRALEFMGLE